MDLLTGIFITPFAEMIGLPDLFFQALWDGFVSGTLYGLIALGFVLIFKASGVFNFAQPILVVLAALALISFYKMGVPAWISVVLVLIMFYGLAWLIERLILRKLVNTDGNILFMSTVALSFIIIGAAQWIFGGRPSSGVRCARFQAHQTHSFLLIVGWPAGLAVCRRNLVPLGIASWISCSLGMSGAFPPTLVSTKCGSLYILISVHYLSKKDGNESD